MDARVAEQAAIAKTGIAGIAEFDGVALCVLCVPLRLCVEKMASGETELEMGRKQVIYRLNMLPCI